MLSRWPWYVCITLAVISYLILSQLAVFPDVPTSSRFNDTTMIFPKVFFILLFISQFLLPLILCIAAGASFIKKSPQAKPVYPSPWLKPRTVTAGNMMKRSNQQADTFSLKVANDYPNPWSLELIKTIEWRSFEKLCAEYFLAKGYKAVETGAGKDGGVDLYLFEPLEGGGLKYDHKPFSAIQCKSWLTKQIGVKTVRELYGVMSAEHIKRGAIVASGNFTDDAMAFAKDKHLQLISGIELLKLITALPKDTQSTLLKKMTAGDYKTPSCPTCDIKMVKRTSCKSKTTSMFFWGCSNFPKCRHIQYISK